MLENSKNINNYVIYNILIFVGSKFFKLKRMTNENVKSLKIVILILVLTVSIILFLIEAEILTFENPIEMSSDTNQLTLNRTNIIQPISVPV